MDRLALVEQCLVVSIQRLGRADSCVRWRRGVFRGRTLRVDAPPRIDNWEGLDINGLEAVTALEVDGVSLTLDSPATGKGTRAVQVGHPWRSTTSGRRAVLFEPTASVAIRRYWWVESNAVPGSLEIETMRLVREVDGSSQGIWETSGFSVGGIAATSTAGLYLAHRPNGAPSEILEFDSDGELTARYPWPLTLGATLRSVSDLALDAIDAQFSLWRTLDQMALESKQKQLPEELSERARWLNEHDVGDGPVVYWFHRCLRLEENPALDAALHLAAALNRPLALVAELSTERDPYASMRHWTFELEGLLELRAQLSEHDIPLDIYVESDGLALGIADS